MEKETIGARIERLRIAKGWSRPELGRQMATALKRAKPFSGEVVRLYEQNENNPSNEARLALAIVFGKTEAYMEFGRNEVAANNIAQQTAAEYRISEKALDVAKRFEELSAACQEHVSKQIDLLSRGDGRRSSAAQHDVVIKGGAVQSNAQAKRRRS